jgi:hypothetical protein
VNAVAARVPAGAKAFFYTGSNPEHWAVDQVDAMWASLRTGTPTVNGYSGTWPAGVRTLIMSDTLGRWDSRGVIGRELAKWGRANGMGASDIAWVADGERRELVSLE